MEASTFPQDAAPAQPTPVTPALIKSFNEYPWVKDRQFLQGLAAMLGPLLPSTDMPRATSISLQARIWWFSTKQSITIAPEAYTAYLASHPDTSSPEPAILARIEDVQRRMGVTGPVPSWQAHAPKADLGVKAADGVGRGQLGDGSGQAAGGGGGDDAPYPEHFKAVIEAVTLGKPVPGIKEIPNTIVRLPGISPVGKMQAPRKPWEKNTLDGTSESTSEENDKSSSALPHLDPEFPPVEDDEPTETVIDNGATLQS